MTSFGAAGFVRILIAFGLPRGRGARGLQACESAVWTQLLEVGVEENYGNYRPGGN